MTRTDLHHAIGWAAWYRRRQRDLDRRRCLLRAIEIRRYLRDTSPPPATRPPLPPVAGTSELVARLLEPQPPPVGDGDSVTDEALRLVDDERIRDLLRARREQGRARYGRELTASNGRDALADAAQEALDLLLYLTQLQMEGRGLILWPLAKVLRQIVDVAEREALPSELPSMPVGGGR